MRESPAPQAPPRTALHEAWTVFRHELRHLALSLRTLLPMGVYAGFGALTLAIFLYLAGRARTEIDAQGVPESEVRRGVETLVAQAFELFGWGTQGDAAEIFRDKVPLAVLFFFLVASYFLPLLVALVSFDQFSELSTRGARFALLRVRRGAYLAGKAAASVASVWLFLGVMWLVVALVVAPRAAEGAGPALRESARAWALMGVLALPYLSLTAFISSLARPGVAFLGTLGAYTALGLGAGFVAWGLPRLLDNAGLPGLAEEAPRLLVLFPWEHTSLLISRHAPTLARGVGALLVLAALGYAATWALVRRRDV